MVWHVVSVTGNVLTDRLMQRSQPLPVTVSDLAKVTCWVTCDCELTTWHLTDVANTVTSKCYRNLRIVLFDEHISSILSALWLLSLTCCIFRLVWLRPCRPETNGYWLIDWLFKHCRAAMRRSTATLLVASMFLSYTALFAWRANLDLTNHLFHGVVSNAFMSKTSRHFGTERTKNS